MFLLWFSIICCECKQAECKNNTIYYHLIKWFDIKSVLIHVNSAFEVTLEKFNVVPQKFRLSFRFSWVLISQCGWTCLSSQWWVWTTAFRHNTFYTTVRLSPLPWYIQWSVWFLFSFRKLRPNLTDSRKTDEIRADRHGPWFRGTEMPGVRTFLYFVVLPYLSSYIKKKK